MSNNADCCSYLRSTKTSPAEAQADTTLALGTYFDRDPPNSMGVHREPGEELWEVVGEVK